MVTARIRAFPQMFSTHTTRRPSMVGPIRSRLRPRQPRRGARVPLRENRRDRDRDRLKRIIGEPDRQVAHAAASSTVPEMSEGSMMLSQ